MKISIDGEVLDFDLESVSNIEAMDLEKATGLTFGEWGEALGKGSMRAMTALVWLARRRDDRDLHISDVTFRVGSIEVDDGDEQADPKESAPGASTAD